MTTETEIAGVGHNNPPTDIENLQTLLGERHAEILKRASDLIEAGDRIPDAVDEPMSKKITTLISQINSALKNIEAQRKNEKDPYWKLGVAVDGFFNKFRDALEDVKKKAQKPLDKYLAEEERKKREALQAEAERIRQENEQKLRDAAALEQSHQQPAADALVEEVVRDEQAAEKLDTAAQAKPSVLAQTRADNGAMASRRVEWTGNLVDRATLDLEALRYHIPEDALDKAIKSFVKAGGRALAGARIFEEAKVVVR